MKKPHRKHALRKHRDASEIERTGPAYVTIDVKTVVKAQNSLFTAGKLLWGGQLVSDFVNPVWYANAFYEYYAPGPYRHAIATVKTVLHAAVF